MANNRVKRLIRDVEGLGFNYDHDASSPRNGRRVYRHPNAPDEVVRVQDAMSDSGVTMVWRKAQQIAGLSTTGSAPSSIRERARVKRASEKERRAAEARAREERAQKADAAAAERQRIRDLEQREREMRELMNPGFGR